MRVMERSASNSAGRRNTSFRLKHFFLRGIGGLVAPRLWHSGCDIFVQLNAHNDDSWRKLGMSRTKLPPAEAGRIKHPEDWATGEEPMTGAQDSYLHTL